MAALAEQADVEASLLRALTAAEETYIDALLARASRAVVAYTGQAIEEVADDIVTIEADLYGNLRLPQIPVTAIASIVAGGDTVDAASYAWDVHGAITCPVGDPFEYNLAGLLPPIVVTYTHGYDPIPADIIEIVADMVAGRLSSSSSGGAVKRAQVDDVTVEYDTTSSLSGTDGLTDDQKTVLNRYRQISKPVNMVSFRR